MAPVLPTEPESLPSILQANSILRLQEWIHCLHPNGFALTFLWGFLASQVFSMEWSLKYLRSSHNIPD